MLTNKESQVCSLVSKGLTNKEIGLKLGIKEKTVKYHLTIIFKKLKIKNRTQLAIKYGHEQFKEFFNRGI